MSMCPQFARETYRQCFKFVGFLDERNAMFEAENKNSNQYILGKMFSMDNDRFCDILKRSAGFGHRIECQIPHDRRQKARTHTYFSLDTQNLFVQKMSKCLTSTR